MDSSTVNSSEQMQLAFIQKKLALENKRKNGVNWLFVIAGVSLINSIIYLTGDSLNFIVGLGITKLIDCATATLAADNGITGNTIIRIVGFGVNIIIAGTFVVLGVLGRKRYTWAIIVGMILYALDGIIFLLLGTYWVGILFHGLALVGLWSGLKTTNELIQLEKDASLEDISSLERLLLQEQQQKKKERKRFTILLIITLSPLVLFLLFLLWYQIK